MIERGRSPGKTSQSRRSGTRPPLIPIVLVMLGVIAALVGWRMLSQEDESARRYDELADEVAMPADERGDDDATRPDEAEESRWADLLAQNPDFAGWLQIDGVGVSLPVTHDIRESPGYYLEHNFWGEPDINGCPYLDDRCTADGRHVLAYGHRMNNLQIMFGPLNETYRQGEFDRLGNATWSTPDSRPMTYVPLCAARVDEGYATVQRFSFLTDEDVREWLARLLSESSARSPRAQELAISAQRAYTCVTCTFSGGQKLRTVVVFVA